MKKKMAKKLSLNKLTITSLNDHAQLRVKGGITCTPTCITNECGTCQTDCGQETCEGPTCYDTCPPRLCTEIYTCKPCYP